MTAGTLTSPQTQNDPLFPRLLPVAAATLAHSTDVPSQGTVRPFGLTLATPLDGEAAALSLDGTRYDPARQLNVNTEGTPVINTPQLELMGTSQDTKEDHQWWTDKD
jgi:putative ATP-grasp target RiPP